MYCYMKILVTNLYVEDVVRDGYGYVATIACFPLVRG
jgi:hypothetical protein